MLFHCRQMHLVHSVMDGLFQTAAGSCTDYHQQKGSLGKWKWSCSRILLDFISNYRRKKKKKKQLNSVLILQETIKNSLPVKNLPVMWVWNGTREAGKTAVKIPSCFFFFFFLILLLQTTPNFLLKDPGYWSKVWHFLCKPTSAVTLIASRWYWYILINSSQKW